MFVVYITKLRSVYYVVLVGSCARPDNAFPKTPGALQAGVKMGPASPMGPEETT